MLRSSRTKMMLLAFVSVFWLCTPILAVAQIAWSKNFNDALKQAAREKKFIVLDISASW